MRTIFLLGISLISFFSFAQDTTIIQTLTYDSTGRDYMFQFPPNNGTSYEKIIMQYSMRCKDGLVSTSGAPNDHGCGEWDYSVNTFITDSAKTDSIKATHPSHVIPGFSGTNFDYTSQATYTYYQYNQQNVVYNSITNETIATVGTGTENIDFPFHTSSPISKTQYLWTASELTAAGLTSGNITGLRLNVNASGDEANYLRIRIKNTSQTILDSKNPETDGFTEVYFLNTNFTNGLNQFNFYNNFSWDGSSNLLVEFSYTNNTSGTNSIVQGHDSGSTMALLSNESDAFLEFSGNGHVNITNSDYSSVSNEITVQFWAFGNVDALPRNTSAFEAVDNQNRRQVHAHLPWGNSRIYWDCGNEGSYDRIDKAASVSELEGQWNHWAFVKNATTGSMKIYLNGNLWHSGTGKNNSIDIQKFVFGTNNNNAYPYFGFIDNFSVWEKELTQNEIQDWMYKDVDATHPEYAYLINYFNLNEGSGFTTSDLSNHQIDGVIEGLAAWKNFRGKDLFKNFTESNFRPNISFVQGVYDQTTTEITLLDSVVNNQNIVYAYQLQGTDIEPVDTNYYYQAIPSNIYDESGTIVGTVDNPSEGTINITTLNYYKKYPSNFELMSFVSPYGLYLDLGMEGKMWQFDVSDLAPILKGNKRLFVTGGSHQEDLDIRFLFIEGTPTRDVVDVQQIWRSGTQRNYSDIMSNKYFEPRTVQTNPAASMFKVRAAITGHGQEGEFIARTHYININGGSNDFQWSVWKECAANPIYPQGGTWVYDRAGWCPGMATDMKEFEITDLVSGGQFDIDYGVTSGSGDSRYIVNCQLVSYGNPNHSLDAEIVEIQRPSKRVEFSRVNPVCYHPTVVIRNTGSTPLTSLSIEYGVSGGTPVTYNWTGNLDFNEKETVELPLQDAGFWLGDDNHIFTATISNPNGGGDEYANNNSQNSKFEMPDMYSEPFIIFLRTNNYAYQNSYTVKDFNGNIIYTKSNLSNSSTYRDTMDLAPGCYTLEMQDSGNDGLDFWANSSQGTGYLRLFRESNGSLIKNFENDFGKEFRYSFVIDNFTYIQDQGKSIKFNVYPNPTTGKVYVDVDLHNSSDLIVEITDVTGRVISKKTINDMFNNTLFFNLENESKGIYFCKIRSQELTQTKKIILTK